MFDFLLTNSCSGGIIILPNRHSLSESRLKDSSVYIIEEDEPRTSLIDQPKNRRNYYDNSNQEIYFIRLASYPFLPQSSIFTQDGGDCCNFIGNARGFSVRKRYRKSAKRRRVTGTEDILYKYHSGKGRHPLENCPGIYGLRTLCQYI